MVLQAPGVLKQEATYEVLTAKEPHSPVLGPINGLSKQEPSYETSTPKDKLQAGDENFPPSDKVRNLNLTSFLCSWLMDVMILGTF